MQFIIIHGSFGSPEGNWFPQLKEKLEALGQTVFAPQFPVDDYESLANLGEQAKPTRQTLESWLTTFKDVVKQLNPKQKVCIIAHSLGPVFSLHAVEKFNLQLDCAIFVSPFLVDPAIPETYLPIRIVNYSFYKANFDFFHLKQLIPLSYVIYSDNDPYVKPSYPQDFAAKLGSSVIPVNKAGHLNAEVNLNEFPLVLELCKSRLNLTLYQKYKAHRSELFDLDYNRDNSEEVIYLQPEEVQDEGLFHFRNLKNSGFCTFYTGITSFWNSQSTYMREARRAALRTKSFTRVFVVENLKDLHHQPLIDQISSDLEAGVHVLLVMYQEIKDQIPEPDFGVWDEEYRCLVTSDRPQHVNQIILSSRKQDIEEALKWQQFILQKATKISTLKDLDSFLINKLNV